MKPLSVDARFFRRWLLANSVGPLVAAMVGGAIVGIVTMLSIAGSGSQSTEVPARSVVGILFGVLFSILLGAPAMILALLMGGAVFGVTIGPPLMGFVAFAFAGVVIGLIQWTVIKDELHGQAAWVVGSACGWSIAGIALGFVADWFLLPLSNPTIAALASGQATSPNYSVFDYAIRYAVTGLGAIGGGISGVIQFFMLCRDYRRSGWWVAGSMIGGAMGAAIASLIITGTDLALGGLTAGAITMFALRQMSKAPP